MYFESLFARDVTSVIYNIETVLKNSWDEVDRAVRRVGSS